MGHLLNLDYVFDPNHFLNLGPFLNLDNPFRRATFPTWTTFSTRNIKQYSFPRTVLVITSVEVVVSVSCHTSRRFGIRRNAGDRPRMNGRMESLALVSKSQRS